MSESTVPAFHVMANPAGSRCNLDCAYCFYLKKTQLYPGSDFRMSDDVMEGSIGQTLAAHAAPHVTISWQGESPPSWRWSPSGGRSRLRKRPLSLDGPRETHDAYRYDRGGHATFDKVVRALRLMQRHQVEFNILCTVNAVNSRHPLEVYRFFRGEMRASYIQFIPTIERDNATGNQEGTRVLMAHVCGRSSLCVLSPTCGDSVGRRSRRRARRP